MRNFFSCLFLFSISLACLTSKAQCIIDTTNTHTGFTPNAPAVVKPGVAYAQTVQVHVPATYSPYTVDSLHILNITGMPSGITYVFNPATGTVLGGQDGAICFSGITNDPVGAYPLTFNGNIYTNAGPIPFSYLVQLSPSFGYKFLVETMPVTAFSVDSPACSIDSLNFTDHSGGYPTHWAWTFAGGSPATSTSKAPVVVYDSAGTYNVTLIARNSIGSDTLTQSITVNPGITGSVTTIPATSSTALDGSASVTVTGGTAPFTYAWSNSNTTQALTSVVQGNYAVSVADTKGCKYVNDSVVITFVNGIVQLGNSQKVTVYPNPASNVLNLTWSEKPEAEVSIVDLNGKVIGNFICNGDLSNAINIKALSAGTYVLRIMDKVSKAQQSMLFNKF